MEAGRDELAASDFEAFRRLADQSWAMTAHTVFTAIDPDRPATVSPEVVGEVIRSAIGFDGVLVSDDLSMEALAGGIGERSRAALAAGCDLVLHCTGEAAEMTAVAAAAGELGPAARRRLDRAAAQVALRAAAQARPGGARLGPEERAALQTRLDGLLSAG